MNTVGIWLGIIGFGGCIIAMFALITIAILMLIKTYKEM